ncbi:MAG: aldolase/citrate lyase family protein [Terriglobia bacterium]
MTAPMFSIRRQALDGQVLSGTFLNLASSLTVEIAGNAGFDWLLIDLEHGSGDQTELVHQLQAAACTPAAPIVRIAWNEAPRFKRVLDLGPSGVMVPYINTAEEARQAVRAMRYPPQGIRGVASLNRACGFGKDFEHYFATANDQLLTVLQIETRQAVEQVEAIASVDGADVLFVGPTDLCASLGVERRLDHPEFLKAVTKVVAACKQQGKAAGILVSDSEQVESMVGRGFTFVAIGSDAGLVAAGMQRLSSSFKKFKKAKPD